jgi:hypothetical protein
MQAEVQAKRLARDGKGTRFKPGQNYYTIKRDRVAAKLNELTVSYFPDGGYTRMDAARLKLAAQHFVDAETCRDPVTRQRATRCGEYLLAKLSQPSSAQRQSAADQAARALELLLKSRDEV